MMKRLLPLLVLMYSVTAVWANGPQLPLALGGQFEVYTNMGNSEYTISPFISGYMKGVGHVKLGGMVESYEQRDPSERVFNTTQRRFFGQVGVDLVMIGGGSYLFYKLSNTKIEKDNSAGDSEWVLNHSMGIGAQHQLDPYLGITAEIEYVWDKQSINTAAPTAEPLAQSVVQINLGILFFIY